MLSTIRSKPKGLPLLPSFKRTNFRGFSLLELLISLPSLAIAALGVLSVITFGTVAGDTAGEFTQATQLGRELTEHIRSDRFRFDPFSPQAELEQSGLVDADLSLRQNIFAPPFDDLPIAAATEEARFKRNVQITPVEPNRLARIQVRVYYHGRKGQEKYVETVALVRENL